MKKPHAHLQTYIKMCVKFQKDQPKTARGVALTRKHETTPSGEDITIIIHSIHRKKKIN